MESVRALDPKAPEFVLPSVPLQSECVVSNGSAAYCNPMVTNCNAEVTSLVPPAAFWEKMELRMTQPPPVPALFDEDPSRYLRFRADFRDQVESRASLTDSEKMNYLMTYTAGKAREVVQNYRGLPNGCHIALQMLRQRFGQNAMVVEALKSSVVNGPKLKNGDSAALLALSDKVQNCRWAMIKLQSKELDCTTNLRQIYDRPPYPLQAKWSKSAKQYRERTGGGELMLKELSEFITAESQTENDPVYGRPSTLAIRTNTSRNLKKPLPTSGQSGETHIPTLSTEINQKEANTPQEDKALSAKGEHPKRQGAGFARESMVFQNVQHSQRRV